MRIAFFVRTFPALSETFILNQITGMLDRGHEVEIYANKKGNTSIMHSQIEKYNLLTRTYYLSDFKMPGNKFVRLFKATGISLKGFITNTNMTINTLNFFKYGRKALSLELLYKISPFLGKGPYDVIHCHFGWVGNKFIELKELDILKGKFITALHGSDMSAYIKKHGKNTYNSLFNKGDLFLPVSNRWKEKLIKMGCEERKIIVHRMGINTDEFYFSPRKRNKNFKLLTVGRFVEKKGIEYGIRAVVKILKRYPHVLYNIAGDGPLRTNLEKLVKKQEACSNIKFLGWQTHTKIKKLIQEANIMITPSVTSSRGDEEGIPVVLMEALATGLPVIASKHSGIPELVKDGKSGFLVPERDIDALTEKLEYLIEHPELWKKMGLAGRKHVEEKYNINKLNDRLEKIYKELIDEKF